MRDIKFRAWDKIKNQMSEVRVIDWLNGMVDLPYPDIERDWSNNSNNDEVILMQYTGIKDKNEKEIYEGDILKGISEHTEIDGTPRTAISVGAVKFYENLCCFMVDRLNAEPEELVDWIQESVYVIGNIYENPELMKGEERIKVKEIKPGKVFKYAGYEWIKLEQEGLALMKDILEKRAFDEESNDWGSSEIRKYLNKDFYETLIENGAKTEDFATIKTDLTADDGTKYVDYYDNISLLTADLYRSNRYLLKLLESWWWLATPYSCLASYSYSVRCVNSSGALSDSSACYGYCGVRPLCNLSSEILVAVDGEEKKGGNRRNEYNRTYKEVGN